MAGIRDELRQFDEFFLAQKKKLFIQKGGIGEIGRQKVAIFQIIFFFFLSFSSEMNFIYSEMNFIYSLFVGVFV